MKIRIFERRWRDGARTGALALALASNACATAADGTESAASVKRAPSPAATPAQPAVQGAEDLAVIWTRPPSAPNPERGEPASEKLYVTRVSTNARWLALDLKSKGRSHGSRWQGRAEAPKVTLTVDGCPAEMPALPALELPYNGAEGRLFMPRAELPRGDLAITISAFGKEQTMIFANDDKGLRTITEDEQKNVMIRPAIPEQGIPETVTVLPSKCEGGQ